jgi:hypothetical protein
VDGLRAFSVVRSERKDIDVGREDIGWLLWRFKGLKGICVHEEALLVMVEHLEEEVERRERFQQEV